MCLRVSKTEQNMQYCDKSSYQSSDSFVTVLHRLYFQKFLVCGTSGVLFWYLLCKVTLGALCCFYICSAFYYGKYKIVMPLVEALLLFRINELLFVTAVLIFQY